MDLPGDFCRVADGQRAALADADERRAIAGDALPRVVETTLFAEGTIGLITVEGPGRNLSVADLIAEAYAMMRPDRRLREAVLTAEGTVTRQRIGEGCGSATMVISDARVSIIAAPMAEAIGSMLGEGCRAILAASTSEPLQTID